MRTPLGLMLIAAVLGIIVPELCLLMAVQGGGAAILVRTLSLAAVPVVATRVAFRRGFEEGQATRQSA